MEDLKVKIETYKKTKEETKEGITKLKMGDTVVELNVGGKHFTCKKTTLIQIEHSFFKDMFEDDQTLDILARDEQGRIFLDMNPE